MTCSPAYVKRRWPSLLLASLMLTVACVGPDLAIGQENPTLKTRWADEVSADNVLPEYPRPQLRRAEWWNLNGEWDYAIRENGAGKPEDFDGKILVPFPVESLLSGVQRSVGPDNLLWYKRSFDRPELAEGERLLLHFGAVDWRTTVWVNGQQVGDHQGGYDPFTFDITDALQAGENELVVSVWDPTDAGFQPRGKQIRRPHGIWYTAVTGIWQTVWLEAVPERYVASLRLVPNAAEQTLQVTANASDEAPQDLAVVVLDDGQEIVTAEGRTGEPVTIRVPDAKLWSPDSPHLYDLVIETAAGDRIESYFGLRDISIGKDDEGVTRILLNGEVLFQYGLLDQGWWPDGLYTAPTDEALRYDLEVTKELGFNMARKHVKVEPARWYYWCDKLGLLVWQDMPSGDKYIGGSDPDITRSETSAETFERELQAMITNLYNYPSVVMWVPYNEGWGQWDTERIVGLIESWDPTRLVNNASGWSDRGVGDVHDIHRYPGPAVPDLEEDRAVVLGEFGGLGLALAGHTWQDERNWGYRTLTTKEELSNAYRKLVMQLHYLVGQGLSAAVYTQTTDVEIEVNGLLTYDREVLKLSPDIAEVHRMLYGPAPTLQTLIPTAEHEPQEWQYTVEEPADDWFEPDFDDSSWRTGKGAFGGNDPPGVQPRTAWHSSDIWLRRTVDLSGHDVTSPMLRVYHDEDATVYANGQEIATLSGYTTEYQLVPLDTATRKLFEQGPVTLAVHCHQTSGGQYIDVGVVDAIVPEE